MVGLCSITGNGPHNFSHGLLSSIIFFYIHCTKQRYMIKFHELRIGNIVLADYEGLRSEGEVTDLNHEDKEVCVETSVQEFWFTPDQLFGIPLDEEQLLK